MNICLSLRLDLKHHRCNRVFTPWILKGYQRTNIHWNANSEGQQFVAISCTAGSSCDSTARCHKWVYSPSRISSRQYKHSQDTVRNDCCITISIIPHCTVWVTDPSRECEGDCHSKGIQLPEAAHIVSYIYFLILYCLIFSCQDLYIGMQRWGKSMGRACWDVNNPGE